MMAYSKEEQETVLVFDYVENLWRVHSTVPKHIRKLIGLGEMEILELENDRPISIKGTLSEKQISMKKNRIITEETKEKLRLRGLAMQGNRV
jgi:bifunctional DNA-binding transcriptional regulator/antitoxin component of YhaV-PrlF toxin-antitoxin module